MTSGLAMERVNSVMAGVRSQQGSALVIALIALLTLTAIGIFAVSTSTLEMKISGVDRELKEAFYTGDSGAGMGIHLARMILHRSPSSVSDLDAPWNNANVVDTGLFGGTSPEVYTDGRNADTPNSDPPDIRSQGDGSNLGLADGVDLRVDIDRLAAYQMAGGGIEFATGHEGLGRGTAGSVGIIFILNSLGTSKSTSAKAQIESGYLHVVGMPGGTESSN